MKKIFLYFFVSLFLHQFSAAQNDAAMLSEGCLYLGKKVYLLPGSYTANQLGIRSRSLSSFHIPIGMALQVFESDGFRGRSETFYTSNACLPPIWKNRVSSLKIFLLHNPGNGGGESGNNLPPQGNDVIFYRDMKYSGISRSVGAGNFGSGALGFLTDNASSIYIPPGHSVQVSDKFGKRQTFTNSISNLAQYGWDNKINSGFIQGNYSGGGGGGNLPPQGDRVIFYRDMKYSGMAKDFGYGAFNSNDLGFLGQNISSIYIPPGQSVKVYDRNNATRTFTTSVSNLAQDGWDNKISTGIIGGSGGGTLPPQGDKVIFYRDIKYSGMAKDVNYGVFTSSSLGFLANNISSVYIPYGWSIEVRDRTGRVQNFNTSMANLDLYGWDNKIYSGTIRNNSGGQQGGNSLVQLYVDHNYSGNMTPYGEGRINNLGFGVGGNISSIKVAPGYAVTVYDKQNLTGNNRTFTGSISNLSTYGWNDKINSVYVFRL